MAVIESGFLRIAPSRRVATAGAMVVAGTAVFQASNFLFHALAARVLGPATYGELAAVVGLLGIATPICMSVQTVASRTATSLYASGRARELRGLLRFYGLRLGFSAALVGSVAALFSGPIAQLLHLDSPMPIVLLAAVLVLGTVSHLQRGVVQGLQRFSVLAAGSAIEGITKIAAAVILLRWIWPGVAGGVVALATASVMTIAFQWAVLHKLPDTLERVRPLTHPLRYSLQTLGTLFLLAMLLSADVIAANRYLTADLAGLYAVVALTGKTVFFATSALTTFAFPLFGDRQERGRDSRPILLGMIGAVVGVSLGAVGLYMAVPTVLLGAIFGSRYSSAAVYIPWAAVAFAAYSLVYLLGMFLLSQRRGVGTAVLAVSVVAQLAGFRLLHGDLWQLLTVQVVVMGATAAALVAAATFRRPDCVIERGPVEWRP